MASTDSSTAGSGERPVQGPALPPKSGSNATPKTSKVAEAAAGDDEVKTTLIFPKPNDGGDDEWEPDVPLFMKKAPGEKDIEENPTLSAISNLLYSDQTPDEIAENFKEQGNEALKRGATYYKDAVHFYSEGLSQKGVSPRLNSILYSNRAAVNLLLGNLRKVIEDCEQAIVHDPSNIKAYWRAAKAASGLSYFEKAIEFAESGLKIEADNKALQSEKQVAEKKLKEKKDREEAQRKVKEAEEKVLKEYHDKFGSRGMVLGKSFFKDAEAAPKEKPWIDDENRVHWPVLFLYPEHGQSDFIQDFMENITFEDQLSEMFPSKVGPPSPIELSPWDDERKYYLEDLDVYLFVNSVTPLPGFKKKKEGSKRYIKLSKSSTLSEVLRHPEHVVPLVAVFHVVVRGSRFQKTSEFAD